MKGHKMLTLLTNAIDSLKEARETAANEDALENDELLKLVDILCDVEDQFIRFHTFFQGVVWAKEGEQDE